MTARHIIRSAIILLTFVSVAATAAPVHRRDVHQECNNFDSKSEHNKTCSSYPPDNVRVLARGDNLNQAVISAAENILFIVPSTNVNAPYTISGPIKLKKGQGFLSTGAGTEGFFYVAPTDDFSIGSDPVYCLVNLNGRNILTGLAIDAREFSPAAIATLEATTVPKALIYTSSIDNISQTWNSLHGRDGLTANILVNNASGSTNSADADYIVRRSWVETTGARHAIMMTAGSNDGNNGHVEFKHLVVKISGNNTSSTVQRGVHLINAKGEIEHNYFTMDNTSFSGDKTRILLTMENLFDTSAASKPTVAENYFHSPKPMLDQHDVALQFLKSSRKDVEIHVYANAYTSNLVPSDANTAGLGKQILLQENYQQQTAVKLVPDWDEFFGGTNEFTTWPRGGICFSSLHSASSLNMTAEKIGSDDAWQYLCGSGLSTTSFNLEHDFEGETCSANDNSCTGYKVATGVLGTTTTVEGVIICVLIGFVVYFKGLANRGNL